MPARLLRFLWLTAACAAAGAAALAQLHPFPNRPVRVIVPFAPGGDVDVVLRTFSHKLSDLTGQPFVIDNRPGASGNIGTDLVARAVADGHTLLATSVPLVVNPSLSGNLNHDVLRDFAPVSLIASASLALVVHPALPASSVKELITYARVRPGELNYASAGSGADSHIAAELFKYRAKVDLVHVPYKGGGLALRALLGGETQVGFIGVLSAAQHSRTGRLRALGVTAGKRSPALADVPTLAESGLPGYEFTSWCGVLAPRATAQNRIVALNGHLRNALSAPEIAERLAREGFEIIASTPEAFGKHLRVELARWATVVKEAGLKAD